MYKFIIVPLNFRIFLIISILTVTRSKSVIFSGPLDKLQLFQQFVHITSQKSCLSSPVNRRNGISSMISCIHVEDFVNSRLLHNITIKIPDSPLLMYFDLVGANSVFAVLKKSNMQHFTTHLHKWLVVVEIESISSVEFLGKLRKILQISNFSQENPIFFIITWNKSTRIEFYVGYRIDSVASPVVLKPIKSEFSADFSTVLDEISKASYQNDFNGTDLIVLGVNDTHFDFDTAFFPDPINLKLEHCFVREVLEAMELILNFRPKLQLSPDWGWLDPDTNTWLGAISSLMNNTADLSISSTARTPDRQEAADYNFPTKTVPFGAVFKRINSFSSSKSFPLLAPFTPNLWFALLFWCFLNYTVYRAVSRVLKQLEKTLNLVKGQQYEEKSYPTSFGAICMQGVSHPPTEIPLRAILLFELIVAVVINAAYGATLVSFISVESNSIKSIAELVSKRYSYFEYTMLMHPVTKRFLKYSPDANARELYWRIFPTGDDDLKYGKSGFDYNDEEATFRKLAAGKLVYVSDVLSTFKGINSVLTPVEACEMQEIQIEPVVGQPQGTVVKKNSKIRRVIDASILKMAESGNLARWMNTHFSFRPRCTDVPYELTGASMSDIGYAIQNLCVVSVMSLIILGCEILHYKIFGFKYIA